MLVKAIHQIIRRTNGKQEIIMPGEVFETSGEELSDFKKAKAISTDKTEVKEARVRAQMDDYDDEHRPTGMPPADEDHDYKADETDAARAARVEKASTATGSKAKAAAPAKTGVVAAAEKKAADKKAAGDAAKNQAAASAAGTDAGNVAGAEADGDELL